MSEYNIKISKLENGSYKLKINNYSRYEVEEVEALAIKYLQKQIEQKENIIKEVREYINEAETSGSPTKLPSGKTSDVGYCLDALEDVEEILDKENRL